MSRSAYVAKVQREECVAYGKCVEIVLLVQLNWDKAARYKPRRGQIPIHILPDNNKWGPEMGS